MTTLFPISPSKEPPQSGVATGYSILYAPRNLKEVSITFICIVVIVSFLCTKFSKIYKRKVSIQPSEDGSEDMHTYRQDYTILIEDIQRDGIYCNILDTNMSLRLQSRV